MNRARWPLAALALIALLVLGGCSASARDGPTPAGRSSPADAPAAGATSPSTARSPGHAERIRLRGRVGFAGDRRGNVDVYLLGLPGGRLRRLTSSPAADLSPTWAPDGRRLAFRSDRDGDDEVYVMNADGGGQRNLTRNRGSDYSPACRRTAGGSRLPPAAATPAATTSG